MSQIMPDCPCGQKLVEKVTSFEWGARPGVDAKETRFWVCPDASCKQLSGPYCHSCKLGVRIMLHPRHELDRLKQMRPRQANYLFCVRCQTQYDVCPMCTKGAVIPTRETPPGSASTGAEALPFGRCSKRCGFYELPKDKIHTNESLFMRCRGEHELEKMKRGEVPHFSFAHRPVNVQRCPCCGEGHDGSKPDEIASTKHDLMGWDFIATYTRYFKCGGFLTVPVGPVTTS
jgi:hypothetical protein